MAKRQQKNKTQQQSKEIPNKGNTYDQILKENFREIVVPMIFHQEGIEPIRSELLSEEINATINRKIDFLMRILEQNGAESIIHIEFQTKLPKIMLYRVAEYHGFLLAKYKLPIRHFVVYLGKSQTKAPTELPKDLHFTGYKLIALNQIPFETLVQSNIPEEIVLAILAHYPKYDPERVVRIILHRLQEVSRDEASLRKFITQLTLLSQLRNLDAQINKITNAMPITIDLSKNALIKDLIDKAHVEWELEHEEKLKAVEEIAEKAALEAEKERQRTNGIILSLYQELHLPIVQIARMVDKDVAYIEDLIAKAAAENAEN